MADNPVSSYRAHTHVRFVTYTFWIVIRPKRVFTLIRGPSMESQNRSNRSDARRHRRRKYIINAAFQWKYTITIALTVFLMCSIMSSALYGILHQQARLRMMNPETYTASVAPVVMLFALLFSAVSAGALGFWCVIATHRICGPLFVLERYLVELSSGRIPKPRALRRKDEFKGLYASFSNAIGTLKATRQKELALLSQARQVVESALEGDDEARREALTSVSTHLDLLHKEAAEALGGDGDDGPSVQTAAPRPAKKTPVAVA